MSTSFGKKEFRHTIRNTNKIIHSQKDIYLLHLTVAFLVFFLWGYHFNFNDHGLNPETDMEIVYSIISFLNGVIGLPFIIVVGLPLGLIGDAMGISISVSGLLGLCTALSLMYLYAVHILPSIQQGPASLVKTITKFFLICLGIFSILSIGILGILIVAVIIFHKQIPFINSFV